MTSAKTMDTRAHPSFWSRRRLTGTGLLLGCFLFLGAAGLIPTDGHGNFIINLPLKQLLLNIPAHLAQLQWSLSLFITGLLVTIFALALFSSLLRDAGDGVYSLLALVALVFGGVCMVIYLAFPLGVDPLAARATATTGVIPDYYQALGLWSNVLFVVYTILAFVALICFGGAVLSTDVLPHWVGWLMIAYALAGLVLTLVTGGNVPPFLQHLVPILVGILLLLPPVPSTKGSSRERDDAILSVERE
jgi:hypothetical protein